MKPPSIHLRAALLAFLLAGCILAVAVQPASAQEGRLRFQRLSVEDGLSQNTVYAILQDHQGFIWLGTRDGLNKYDGYTFTVYRHILDDPHSLGSSTVSALLEDRQGTLWVGTTAGLDRFDRPAERFIPIDRARLHHPVTCLIEDADGRLWVGTGGDGLKSIDPASGMVTSYPSDPSVAASLIDPHVTALQIDPDGRLWVATQGGLDRFDPVSGSFIHYPHDFNQPNSPSSDRIQSLLVTPGTLWIGTGGAGLNRLDLQTGQFGFFMSSPYDPTSISSNDVTALLAASGGLIWAGTTQGLNVYDPQANRFTSFPYDPADPDSLGSSRVLCLYEDRSGILWICLEGAGVSQFKPAAHKFRTYLPPSGGAQNLGGDPVMAVLEDRQGAVWIGASDSGLSRLDRRTGQWQRFQHFPNQPGSLASNHVTALLEDRSGTLWAGTSGGLDRFDPTSSSFAHFRYTYGDPDSLGSNWITSLLQGEDGSLWIGTDGAGLDRLDPLSTQITHYRSDPQDPYSLPEDRITCLALAPGGRLWVGLQSSGLALFDPASGQVIRRLVHQPQDPNSLSGNEILALSIDPGGLLWIGTKDGLNRYDPASGDITRYTSASGLPADMVTCTLPGSSGELWVATTNGLARLDPPSGSLLAYSVDDGLLSRELVERACFRSRSGELFFGGVGGLNAFFPQQVIDHSVPPPVVITAFKKFNQLVQKDLQPGATIQLTYRDSFISFEFAALDFNAPQENQYAYRLAGFDGDWIQAGSQRAVSYTNLKGGSYTFQVRAANSDGAWNQEGASVHLVVTPPFWETAWFRSLAGLGLFGLLLGGYRLRVQGIEARNRELERRVAELSAEVRQAAVTAERSRLARDLHDSVTQSLYSLALLAEAGQRHLQAGDIAQAQEYAGRVGDIAQQALQEMRLMVFELRPPALEEAGLAGALEHRLEAVERRAGLEARLVVEGTPSLSPQAEEELYLLALEALNNALKHAHAPAVTVRLCQEGARFTLEVADTGRGFDPERGAHAGGLGLTTMRERAARAGGQLDIRSTPGSGSCVTFTRLDPS